MRRWLNSVSHAARGIGLVIRHERNLLIELFVATLVLLISWWLQLNTMEWCIILMCIGIVIAAEMFNSAIERLCDIYSTEHHPGIRDIKDMAAGAVFFLSIIAAVIGFILLLPKGLVKAGLAY